MGEAGRDVQRSSDPISLLKEGNIKPLGQDQVYMAFEYLQGLRIHSTSGKPISVLGHPHREKKCFFIFRGNLLYFNFCTLPLILSLGTTEKSLVLSSFHFLFRYLNTMMRP